MKCLQLTAALALLAMPASAQTVEVGPLDCLPLGENAVATASIQPPPTAEMHVRLNFRRMNIQVEDFYFTEMVPTGNGAYWGVFPQPENSEFDPKELERARADADKWAQWWRAKEASDHRDPNTDLDREVIEERAALGKRVKRDWMDARDDRALQEYFERQKTEPAEYFVSLVDPSGREVARSAQQVVEVRSGCPTRMTAQQAGMAANLTVGESGRWQAGGPPFHWECTGVVTRLDPTGVLRSDDACRACVIAWWKDAAGAAAILGTIGVVTIDDDPKDPEVSPSRP